MMMFFFLKIQEVNNQLKVTRLVVFYFYQESFLQYMMHKFKLIYISFNKEKIKYLDRQLYTTRITSMLK